MAINDEKAIALNATPVGASSRDPSSTLSLKPLRALRFTEATDVYSLHEPHPMPFPETQIGGIGLRYINDSIFPPSPLPMSALAVLGISG